MIANALAFKLCANGIAQAGGYCPIMVDLASGSEAISHKDSSLCSQFACNCLLIAMSVASVINLKHGSLDVPKSEDRDCRGDCEGPGFLLQSPWCAICQPLAAIHLIQIPIPAAFTMSCWALLRHQPIRTRICDRACYHFGTATTD